MRSARFPLWMKVVLGVEVLAALTVIYIGLLVGSAFPMPAPSDIRSIGPLALPLAAIPFAYLLCRKALDAGRRRTAILALILPIAVFLVVVQ